MNLDTPTREQLTLGFMLQQAGRLDEARPIYEAVLEKDPDQHIALALLGALEGDDGDPKAAIPLLERALALQPDDDSSMFNLALNFHRERMLEDAQACFERAMALRPGSIEFQRQYAEVTWQLAEHLDDVQHLWEDLLARADAALAEPGDATRTQLLLVRGHALLRLNRRDEAVACLERIDFGTIDSAMVAAGLSAAFEECGATGRALAVIERAIALRPTDELHLRRRSALLIRAGDFERGWAEFEHRAHLGPGNVPWIKRAFGCPRWDGQAPLAGRTILVHTEQGLGDGIHFARYAPVLAELGARVLLEAHKPLVRLLGSLEGVETTMPFLANKTQCDYHCSVMSLPYFLSLYLGRQATWPKPYLHAEPELTSAWRERVGGGFHVGLAWSGNPQHSNDRRRSLSLKAVLPHLLPDVRWWCVQKQVRYADRNLLRALARQPGGASVETPVLGDFADTAALIACMDVVVTVDTSVAHLAGALGKPVLMLLSEPAEWRWQDARTDTPWYDTMRLFRQPIPGDWQSAIAAAMAHLRGLAARAAPVPVTEPA